MPPIATRLPVLVVVLLALVIAGPLAAADAAQSDDNILRVPQIVYPDIVDPQRSSFAKELHFLALAIECLTLLDTNQEIVPGAVASWDDNDDATQITFTLRPSLTFSDGSPLAAEHFNYAADRTCDPATAGDYQAILFEIVGCAEFAGLVVDEDGEAREYTPQSTTRPKQRSVSERLTISPWKSISPTQRGLSRPTTTTGRVGPCSMASTTFTSKMRQSPWRCIAPANWTSSPWNHRRFPRSSPTQNFPTRSSLTPPRQPSTWR